MRGRGRSLRGSQHEWDGHSTQRGCGCSLVHAGQSLAPCHEGLGWGHLRCSWQQWHGKPSAPYQAGLPAIACASLARPTGCPCRARRCAGSVAASLLPSRSSTTEPCRPPHSPPYGQHRRAAPGNDCSAGHAHIAVDCTAHLRLTARSALDRAFSCPAHLRKPRPHWAALRVAARGAALCNCAWHPGAVPSAALGSHGAALIHGVAAQHGGCSHGIRHHCGAPAWPAPRQRCTWCRGPAPSAPCAAAGWPRGTACVAHAQLAAA